MKYFTAILLLAATAFAAPGEEDDDSGKSCKFGTYQCTKDNTGIEICDIAGQFELVGDCPKGTACQELPQNGFDLPFCTNKVKKIRAAAPAPDGHDGHDGQRKKGPQPGDKCTTPGQYQCLGRRAIQVCDIPHVLVKVGNCPKGSHCDYINNIPYCVV